MVAVTIALLSPLIVSCKGWVQRVMAGHMGLDIPFRQVQGVSTSGETIQQTLCAGVCSDNEGGFGGSRILVVQSSKPTLHLERRLRRQ